MPTCPELTALQKAAGFIDLLLILEVGAIILAVVCVCILFANWLWPLLLLLKIIPVQIYEAAGYLGAIFLLGHAYFVPQSNQLWFSLGGSLGLAGMLVVTSIIHDLKPNYVGYFSTVTVIFGAVALYFHEPIVGFFAVTALMSALGFCAFVIPCGFVIGFQDDSALYRGTTAALMILIVFVAAKILHVTGLFTIFEAGALWMGSFVGYLGLLITSSKWHLDWGRHGRRGGYFLRQVITILFGAAALAVGSIYDIHVLRGVGGTFFMLYLIVKPFELPVEGVTAFAAIGLVVAAGIGSGVYWAQNHLDLVQPYMLF